MRDLELRRWRALVRERAKAEWRELSLEVVDELACPLADLHTAALANGATETWYQMSQGDGSTVMECQENRAEQAPYQPYD